MRLYKNNFLNWAAFIFANNPDMYLGLLDIFFTCHLSELCVKESIKTNL